MTRFVTVLLVINLSVLFSPLLAQERPAYVLTEVTIHDRIAYQEYEAEFMPIVERYGGELIAVTDDPTVLEGLWSEMRVVLIRFETRQDALDCMTLRNISNWPSSDGQRRQGRTS